MSVDVGELPQQSSPFNRRNLLIGAAVLGGAVGLVILIARMRSGTPAENQAQTSAPKAGALDIAYQNLAEQLLGLRGDLSVANADLASGQQDLLTAVGQEAADRATSDQTLFGMLSQWFTDSGSQLAAVQNGIGNVQASVDANRTALGGISGQITGTSGQLQQISGALGGVQNQLSATGNTVSANTAALQLIGLRQYYGNQYDPLSGATSLTGRSPDRGAGGATLRDAILATFDGGYGDASDGLRRLSAGPVRVMNTDRRN